MSLRVTRWIRAFLRRCRHFPGKVYGYSSIDLTSTDYDLYWKNKRGDDLLGRCNSFQLDRANWVAARVTSGSSIADIGCGDGAVLGQIIKQRPVKGMGVDISKYALSYVSSMGCDTLQVDAFDVGFFKLLPETDYILMLEFLEHVVNAEIILKESLRVARKNVFFSVPNTGYITHRLRLLFGKFPVQWRLTPNEHIRFWTYSDLKWWLHELGLQDQYEIAGYQGIPILNRLLPNIFAAGTIVNVRVRR